MDSFNIIPGKTLIVSDIDGVIADTISDIIVYIWDRYKVRIEESDIVEYNVARAIYEKYCEHTCYDNESSKEFAIGLFGFWKNPGCYVNAKPYPEMWKLYHNWRSVGGEMVFATSRARYHCEITANWLVRFGLVERGTIALHTDKIEAIDLLLNDPEVSFPEDHNSILYIEDDARKVAEASETFKDDPRVMTLCIARPWNDIEFPRNNVVRLAPGFNWKELQEAIDDETTG